MRFYWLILSAFWWWITINLLWVLNAFPQGHDGHIGLHRATGARENFHHNGSLQEPTSVFNNGETHSVKSASLTTELRVHGGNVYRFPWQHRLTTSLTAGCLYPSCPRTAIDIVSLWKQRQLETSSNSFSEQLSHFTFFIFRYGSAHCLNDWWRQITQSTFIDLVTHWYILLKCSRIFPDWQWINKLSGGRISTLITISYSFKIDSVLKKYQYCN